MSNQTMHTVLIDRGHTGTIETYFEMQNITNFKIIRICTKKDKNILDPYENIFNKKLGMRDAVVISPLSQTEINTVIKNYCESSEIYKYQEAKSERGLLESREEQDVNLF